MCGRFTVTATPDELFSRFGVSLTSNLQPRWNVAPSQSSPIIQANGFDRGLSMARFGVDNIVPHKTLINARSETITEKAAFQDAFRNHRCLVIASGWYEWKEKGKPYHIQLRDGRVMGFAGLLLPQGGFVIVTSAATGALSTIHHRVPHVLAQTQWDSWLMGDVNDALAAFTAVNSDYFNAYPVSPDVGNVRHDHAGLVAPYEAPPATPTPQADLFS